MTQQKPSHLHLQRYLWIIAAVTTFLSQQDAFISELSEFGDPFTSTFSGVAPSNSLKNPWQPNTFLAQKFSPVAPKFQAKWHFIEPSYRSKTLIMVSKLNHYLNDLLYRHQARKCLSMDIEAVVSNHPDLQGMVKYYGIPYLYLPVHGENKLEQEKQKIQSIDEKTKFDLTAPWPVTWNSSPTFTSRLPGKIINIHHSFLPSFKGAKPYHQAFERGVKIIGATAHYVTENLDEGPIIEQEVLRVGHIRNPEELVSIGYDIEAQVLARAVKYHIENRIFINGTDTIIFK